MAKQKLSAKELELEEEIKRGEWVSEKSKSLRKELVDTAKNSPTKDTKVKNRSVPRK